MIAKSDGIERELKRKIENVGDLYHLSTYSHTLQYNVHVGKQKTEIHHD